MTTDRSAFAAYGAVASGERFIGREGILERLRHRLIAGGTSAALVGMPRIGKSSIAVRMLGELEKHDQVEAIWINGASYSSGTEFFDELAAELAIRASLPPDLISTDSFKMCRRQLRQLHATDGRVVLVVDEFDAIRYWPDSREFLNRLRELIYLPEVFGLACLFVSRRAIESLELSVAGISTFAGVCEQIFVTHFTHAEVAKLINRAGEPPIFDCAELVQARGGHPMLSERFLNAVAQGLPEDCPDDYFEALLGFLQDEDLAGHLIMRASGVSLSTQFTEERVAREYGFWSGAGAFCESFEEYLQHAAMDLSLWEEFGKAERAIRTMLTDTIAGSGRDLLDVFAERNPAKGEPLRDEASKRRASDQRKWPRAGRRPLVDYTYPGELWQILSTEWQQFRLPPKYRDRRWWEERINELARVRAPLAHGREDILEADEVAVARATSLELAKAAETVAKLRHSE